MWTQKVAGKVLGLCLAGGTSRNNSCCDRDVANPRTRHFIILHGRVAKGVVKGRNGGGDIKTREWNGAGGSKARRKQDLEAGNAAF